MKQNRQNYSDKSQKVVASGKGTGNILERGTKEFSENMDIFQILFWVLATQHIQLSKLTEHLRFIAYKLWLNKKVKMKQKDTFKKNGRKKPLTGENTCNTHTRQSSCMYYRIKKLSAQ